MKNRVEIVYSGVSEERPGGVGEGVKDLTENTLNFGSPTQPRGQVHIYEGVINREPPAVGSQIHHNMMKQLSAIDEIPEIEDDNLSPQVLSIQRELNPNDGLHTTESVLKLSNMGSGKHSPGKFLHETPKSQSPSRYGSQSHKGNRLVLKNLSTTYLMKEKE